MASTSERTRYGMAESFKENEQISPRPETEAFLVSAADGYESQGIEGRLRSAGIPFLKKQPETGGYMKIIMGYSAFGNEFYVAASQLEQAREVLDLNGGDAPAPEELAPQPDAAEQELAAEEKRFLRNRRIALFFLCLFAFPIALPVWGLLALVSFIRKSRQAV